MIDLAIDTGLAHDLLTSPTMFNREPYEAWRWQERALVLDLERERVPL